MLTALAALSLAIWLYLLIARGGFWRFFRAIPRQAPASWPRVAIVVPARNEAALVGRTIASLLAQDYAGPFHIWLVDDESTDGTAEAAGRADRLTVVQAGARPPGWAGKVWAMRRGLGAAEAFAPEYVFFTDADIAHAPAALAELVALAAGARYDLASRMVRLRTESLAERAVAPAFVFFFFLLYPPAWTAHAGRATAGAAGGSLLVRRAALDRAGGLEAIRGAVIDDCALAGAVKRSGGNVLLGLAPASRSLREYADFRAAGRMISRTAYTQLRYSPLLLLATVAGMFVTYVVPPLAAFALEPLGAAAWLLMSLLYLPALRFHGRSPLWAPLLPAVAAFYAAATVASAVEYYRGRGGAWKDRVQAARL